MRINMLAIIAAGFVSHVASAQRSGPAHAQPRETVAAVPATDNAADRTDTYAAGRRYEKQGVQVGQAFDDSAVFSLDGKALKLAAMWKDRPTLIVTASLTSPIAREQCPKLASIIERFDPEARVLVLYTLEAHPKGSASPYSPGREWVTAANEAYGVLHAQTTTLEQRLTLAREMSKRLGKSTPMIVDAMDNKAWQTLGGGPNLAVLVDTDGRVVAKQGWFDAESMSESIDALLKRHVNQAAGAYESGKSARPEMEKFIEALRRSDREAIDAFYAPDARGWRGQKSGEGAPAAADPWRAWDAQLNLRSVVESARIEADKVVVETSDVNDFARLIGFGGWRATTTYWFNDAGRITGRLDEPAEARPTLRECFAPALDWARQHRADELKAIYPGNEFAPSADAAKRWRDLLVEWRKATGKPAIDLS